jgi:small-conductance mechanosensitive channel
MATIPNECECCSNLATKEAPLKLFMAMWMCPGCVEKNKSLTAISEAGAEDRVNAERERAKDVIAVNSILKQAQSIDNNIQIKADLFNAETVAIYDIAQAIHADANVLDKHGAVAEAMLKRYQLYKEKIFANTAENVELANKQNAIHKYLNELKAKLTEEEREKYHLLNIDYKPNQVKIKPINSPAKPKKWDKADIVNAAKRANVPTSVIQMICVAKNMTPMQASDSLLNAGSKTIEGE